MGTYNLAVITEKIYNSGFSFFNLKTLMDVLDIKKEATLFNVIKRLLRAKVLIKVERDKYLLKGAEISDFKLANFLYRPSYISFESALNFYGILSQFPYQISSATSRKTVRKIFQKKEFVYTHLKKELFWGYEKKGGFIIALPEKALLDQLYLSAKGYKKINLDECDFARVNIARFRNYLSHYPKTRQFETTLEELKQYISL